MKLLANWEVYILGKTGHRQHSQSALSLNTGFLSTGNTIQEVLYNYNVQPSKTNLPIIWISDDCVRKQK